MTKFIEVIIDGSQHMINIDNIAMLKSVSAGTEIHLLTKDKNGQIAFKVPVLYGQLKYIIQEQGRFEIKDSTIAIK